MLTIPSYETERLLLRALRSDDAHAYAEHIFSDADVMRYMSTTGTVHDNPKAVALGYISERNKQWREMGFGAWAVVEKATSRFMGHVGLFIIDHTDVVEVGYALGKVFWGKGYATEAAQEALRYGFVEKDMQKIEAVAFPDNVASIRVMAKLGMQDMGITDEYYNTTLAHYRMTRTQFMALYSTP